MADDAFFEQVRADGDELAAYVRKTTYDLETPDIRTAFANTYVEAHPLVAEELAWFEEYSAGFADEAEPADDSPGRRGGQLMTTMTIAKAINEGLRATLNNNPRALLMGEDIGPLGGVYRVTDGLIAEFGADRVVDTPLAESGIIGTAIGLSLRGYLPVCEIQFDGFVFPGFNQITTQLAKMHSRSNGNLTVPVVIRIPYGGGIGSIEHHSESPEALFAHTAGPAHHHPVQPARRLLDDPAGRRLPGPRDRLRTEAPLLAQGRGRHRIARTLRGPVQGTRAPRGNGRHRGGLRTRWCRWPWPRPTPPPRTATASR